MSLHPDKKPFRILRKWRADVFVIKNRAPFTYSNVPHVEYESDFWEGPDGSGNPTGYRTARSVVNAVLWRNSLSPNASFCSELLRALGVKIKPPPRES